MGMEQRDKDKMIEWLRVMNAMDVKNASELRLRIHDYLRWCWDYEMRGETLGQLNRRFGVMASRHGLKTRNIAAQLMLEDKVVLITHGQSLVIIDIRFEAFLEPDEDAPVSSLDDAMALFQKKRENVLNASVGKA